MTAMENAHGLIVGIANYERINKLPPTVLADARDIFEALTNPNRCAYPQRNVELLLDKDAKRELLQEAMTRLCQRTDQESTVFIYLSGHGGRIESGRNAGEYLLPMDTVYSSDDSLAATAISGIQFTQMLRAIPARKVVVVFDTCFSGGVGQPKDATAPEFKRLPERFYETLATGRGRVIMASSRSTEVSYVFPDAPNSLFTQHMLSGLRGGAPGAGGVIRVFDLFHHLQPRVTRDCPHQHPIFKAEVEENFPLALHLGGKEADSTSYQSIVNLMDNAAGKTGRIMRQLDLLLGTEQKLPERDRGVLVAALFSVTGNNSARKGGEGPTAKSSGTNDEVKEVIDRFLCDPGEVGRPSKYSQTASSEGNGQRRVDR